MNWKIIRTIAIKDLLLVRQNKAAWIPAVIVPVLMMALIPAALILIPTLVDMPAEEMLSPNELAVIMRGLPPVVSEQLVGLDEVQTWIVLMTGYLMAPMFLIVPLMFASIVAADSFVGEKERKTLEGLLYTPATDRELLLGKVVASIVPAVVLAWGSFVLYTLVVNAAGWPAMGRLWFPLVTWWPLILWVAPAVATLGMAMTVLISSRVSTFMEANQLAGVTVLLVLGLIAGQATGVLALGIGTALVVGLVVWIAAGILLFIGARTFHRDALLARL